MTLIVTAAKEYPENNRSSGPGLSEEADASVQSSVGSSAEERCFA